MENNFQTPTRQQQLKINFEGEIVNGAHVDFICDNNHCRRQIISNLFPGGFAGDKDDSLELSGNIDRDEERVRRSPPPSFRQPFAPQTAGSAKDGGNAKVTERLKLKGDGPLVVAENHFQTKTRQQQIRIDLGGEIVQNLGGCAETRQGENANQQTEQVRGTMGTPFPITGGQQQRQRGEGWTGPG